MAGVNGIVGTLNVTEKEVVTDFHPAVNRTVALKANNGVVAQGTILAYNASGTAEAYDPAATEGSTLLTPIGVLVYKCDTARDTAGIMLVHGVVMGDSLVVAGGDAADEDDIAALTAALPIWTV